MNNKSNDLNPKNERFNEYQDQANTIASRQDQKFCSVECRKENYNRKHSKTS